MGDDDYWNKENFEGLLAIAAELRPEPHFEHLARYCELREQGLRKQALAAIDAFLEGARHWDAASARAHVLTLLEVAWAHPMVHQFPTTPVLQQLVEPVLDDWRRDAPGSPTPTRYLGLLRRDPVLLEAALSLVPADTAVRAALVLSHLCFVDYATHHLSESFFIGDEEEAEATLKQAEALLAEVGETDDFRQLIEEAKELRQLLDDWRHYQRQPDGSFPDWCQARNRTYTWTTAIYYER